MNTIRVSSIARATLSHAWRRVLLVTCILAAAGVICYLQLGVSMGQILSFVTIERLTPADLIVVSPPSRRSDKGNQPLVQDVVDLLDQSPLVKSIESISVPEIAVRLGAGKMLDLNVVETRAPSLSLPGTMTEEVTTLLDKPYAIVLTEKAMKQAGLSLGDVVPFRDKTLWIAGVVRGGLGTRDSMISRRTFEYLDDGRAEVVQRPIRVALVQLADGVNPDDAAKQLTTSMTPFGVEAFTRPQLVSQITKTAVEARLDLQGFLLVGIIVAAVAIVIVMQATISNVAAQSSEFGVLLALGTPASALVLIVLEQVFWIGVLGAGLAIVGALIARVALTSMAIEYVLLPEFFLAVSATIVAATLVGGLASLPAVFSIKPKDLLR